MKKNKKNFEAGRNMNRSKKWFRHFLLSSLCAAAVAVPAGAWGTADEWIGSRNSSDAKAELKNALSVTIDGKAEGVWQVTDVSEPRNIFGAKTVPFSEDPVDLEVTMSGEGSLTIYGIPTLGISEPSIVGGYVYANNGSAAAYNNKVTISSTAAFDAAIYGGYAESETASATASNNKLTITGGKFNKKIYGGYAASISNSDSALVTVSGNELTISGGEFTTDIYGGYAVGTPKSDPETTIPSVIVSNNILTISGGVFTGNIYAGFAESALVYGIPSAICLVQGNTLILKGNPNISQATLYGGGASSTKGGFGSSTLEIYSSGLEAKNIGRNKATIYSQELLMGSSFTNIYFVLPKTMQSIQSGNTTPVLTLTAENETTYLKDVTFTVTVEQGSSLKKGDSVNLLYSKNSTIEADDVIKTGEARVENGVAAKYEFEVYQSGDKKYIIAAITKAGGSEIYGSLNAPLNHAIVITKDGKTEPAKDWESPAEDTIAGSFIFGVKNDKTEEGGDAIASMGENGSMTIEGTGNDSPDIVYGVYAYTESGKAESTNSKLIIQDGTFSQAVYSGYANGSESAKANNNTLTINGGNFFLDEVNTGIVSGFTYSKNGKVTSDNNTLTISGGTFTLNKQYTGIDGGCAYSNTNSAAATGNTLIITGGKFDIIGSAGGITAGLAESNSGTVSSSSNTAIIKGGKFLSHNDTSGIAAGGTLTNSADTIASLNSMIISGGTFGAINGKTLNIFAGLAVSNQGISTASSNTMTISGGIFTAPENSVLQIAAGLASGIVQNNVSGNTLTISGGVFTGDGTIYIGAGMTVFVNGLTAESVGRYENNTIIITGTPKLDSAVLDGAPAFVPSDIIPTTYKNNNTLEIRTSGLTAKNVLDFQNYTFILPSGIKNNDVVITLTGFSNYAKTNISGSTVTVGISQGVLLYPGDTIVLLRNENGLISTGFTQKKITTEKGLALSYNFDVTATPIELLATVSSVKASEKATAPVEGQTIAPAMLNQAADLLATEGIQSLLTMPAGSTMGSFLVASGGNLRHNTGSHANVQGVSTLLGIGKRFDPSFGAVYTGAFFEYGYGDYSTHNDFSSGYVRGDGHSRYYGIGLAARYDHSAGFYVDGSLRFGRSETRWATSYLGTNYDSEGGYFGLHFAAGYLRKFADKFKLDVYSKYFYAYQDGDNVTILGDPFKFDSVNSNRLRLGARLSYDYNEMLSGYVGAGWEREFSGTANAAVYGYDIAAPSLKGNSGIFEGGLSFKPKKDLAFSTDIGIVGYVGQKKGVSGMVKLNYSF